ncbi:Astacin (Peptidase family M12A) [Polystyrenella longa]|uniref:Astacin (Peptidase family M12A) n=2 Tax=Polystyrenella longa TaxID=2528007 RepID=A0A518CNA2_9PLAN|nr:Astacin (Peptidase family M12A) [Polystyrenella longa]
MIFRLVISVSILFSLALTGNADDPKACITLDPSPNNVGLRLAGSTTKLWQPGQTLKIMFLGGTPSLQQRVIKAAEEWTKYANINFEYIQNGRSDIRIAFIANNGSWSTVGTDASSVQQNQPTMNFGWFNDNTPDVEIARTTLHEFGHALGMIHEHQSPDSDIPWNKPEVYKFYLKQTPPWYMDKVDHNIFRTHSATNTNFSSFDVNSIMIYPISNDLTIGDFEVEMNTKLSDVDKSHIAKLYPGRWTGNYTVTLDSLTCIRKQEASANDEVHLRVWSDGQAVNVNHPDRLFGQQMRIFKMSTNRPATLNLQYSFKRSLKVEVWELDNPRLGDNHDLFGCVTITDNGPGESLIALKQNRFGIRQHEYKLTWK